MGGRDGEREISSRITRAPILCTSARACTGAAARRGEPDERAAIILETEGADLEPVADGELVRIEPVPIDEAAGEAVQVAHHAAAAGQRLHLGVPARDAGIVQDDVAVRIAPDGELGGPGMRSAGMPFTRMSPALRCARGVSPGGRLASPELDGHRGPVRTYPRPERLPEIFAPLTCVPRTLPRSSTEQVSPFQMKRQWRREISIFGRRNRRRARGRR